MKNPANFSEFQATLVLNAPPKEWPVELCALWYDANDDWQSAHNLIDHLSNPMAKRVHAYLHRKEGDEWNAGYWYRQAKKPFCTLTLDEELRQLIIEILE